MSPRSIGSHSGRGGSWPRWPISSTKSPAADRIRLPDDGRLLQLFRSSAGTEDLVQFGGHRRVQLDIGARIRFLVRTPADEGRRVPEAVDLEVVVGDLHHQLGAYGLPAEVFARAPAALATGDTPSGGAFGQPRVTFGRVAPVGVQGVDELGPPSGAEPG